MMQPQSAPATSDPLLTQVEALLRAGAAPTALALLQTHRPGGPAPAHLYSAWLRGWALLDLGRHSDAYATLQAALADPASAQDARVRTLLLNGLGNLYHTQGRFPVAAETFGVALQHAERLQPCDHGLRARLLVNLAGAALKCGQVEAASTAYERAIVAAECAHDLRRLGMAHMGLALARHEAQDYATAVAEATQAITLFAGCGEAVLARQARMNLALTYLAQEQWVEALPPLTQVLSEARRQGDRTTEAHALEVLARAHALRGDHARAAELAHAARLLAEQLGDRLETASAAVTEAGALTALGQAAAAEVCYQSALATLRALGASRRLMGAAHAYARALRSWGRGDAALDLLDQTYEALLHLQQG